jgi:hypothetical protein
VLSGSTDGDGATYGYAEGECGRACMRIDALHSVTSTRLVVISH